MFRCYLNAYSYFIIAHGSAFTSPSFKSSAICAATAKKLSSSEVSMRVTGILEADAAHNAPVANAEDDTDVRRNTGTLAAVLAAYARRCCLINLAT
jgi:hypothetical protein